MALQKKLAIVGDCGCGKNCLPIAFAKDTFNTEYNLTTESKKYIADVELGDIIVGLFLWGILDQKGFDGPTEYAKIDVVLICFSVTSKDSLNNVTATWYPEVRHFCPDVPILLIGTKSDLRDDKEELANLEKIKKKPVTREEAESVAKTIGAVLYIECSAKTKFNVREVFVEAARAAIETKKERKRGIA